MIELFFVTDFFYDKFLRYGKIRNIQMGKNHPLESCLITLYVKANGNLSNAMRQRITRHNFSLF
jgi:hypothetical protein